MRDSIELPTTPAKTYGLNVIASIAGRFAIDGLRPQDKLQLEAALDEQITHLDTSDVPDMPLWEPEAVKLAKQFDIKLMDLIDENLRPSVEPTLAEKASDLIIGHLTRLEEVEESGTGKRDMVPIADIASAFGVDNLFDDPEQVIANEINEWSSQVDHPDIPANLQAPTDRDTTAQLLDAAWRELFGYNKPIDATVYTTDREANYHLYWTALGETLDYATPHEYALETQLSFDIPHNAAHLLHLHKLKAGALDYLDRMPERAYFESVALLSEYMVTQHSEHDSLYFEKLSEIICMPTPDIARWVIEDRMYEFKLRAARFLGDILLARGVSYEDTAREVVSQLNIPIDHAKAEVSKYMPWLGLNAVYVKGYRNLLKMGINNVLDAIEPKPSVVVKTWRELREAALSDTD